MGTTMSFGLTIPSRSLAADSIVPVSFAIRRISTCNEALERRMEAISEVSRPYSSVEPFSSALDRTITVEHIPRVAISIIARKTHEGIKRNQSSVAGPNSLASSRTGSEGSAWAAIRWVTCRLLSQYVFPILFKEHLLGLVSTCRSG